MAQLVSNSRPSTLVASALSTYGTQMSAAALSLVNIFVVSRALGAIGRGDVALLMTIPVLTAYLGSFGVQEANANIGAAEPSMRPGLATNSLIFAAGLSMAAAGIVVALVTAIPRVGGQVDRRLLWFSLLAIPLFMLKLFLQFLLQADYRFTVTNLAWVLGPLTTATVNSLMWLLGVITVGTAIAVWLTGQLLGALILVVSVHRHFGFARPDAQLARRCLVFGLKTHAGRFMDAGNYRADQWFVGAMAGSRELGVYSVAVAWAELLFYIPGVIVLLQRPDLVRASSSDAAVQAARIFRRAMFLSAAAGAVLIVAAPLLCTTFFSAQFHASIIELRVLALGALGIVSTELLTNALVAQRQPLLASGALGASFVLALVLDVLLIPLLGGLGAAIATTAAYTGGGIAAIVIFTHSVNGTVRDLVPRFEDVRWYVRTLRTMPSMLLGSRARQTP